MSKWYGISNEGDLYSLGHCKDFEQANEVADDIGVDIVSIIDQPKAEAWANFIFKTLNEEEYDD